MKADIPDTRERRTKFPIVDVALVRRLYSFGVPVRDLAMFPVAYKRDGTPTKTTQRAIREALGIDEEQKREDKPD